MLLTRTAGRIDGNEQALKRISLVQDGKEVNFGYSPSEADNLNHFLQFVLKKNTSYTIVYPGKEGERKGFEYKAGNNSGEVVKLYQ